MLATHCNHGLPGYLPLRPMFPGTASGCVERGSHSFHPPLGLMAWCLHQCSCLSQLLTPMEEAQACFGLGRWSNHKERCLFRGISIHSSSLLFKKKSTFTDNESRQNSGTGPCVPADGSGGKHLVPAEVGLPTGLSEQGDQGHML